MECVLCGQQNMGQRRMMMKFVSAEVPKIREVADDGEYLNLNTPNFK